VNSLHIKPLYKLHNKLSCVSSQSSSKCQVCPAVLFDELDTGKMHGIDTSNVLCHVEKWRVKWNLSYTKYCS